MTNPLTWLPLLPVALMMVAAWWWASYYWVRLLRVPTPVALAVSPAVTTAIILPLSIVWYRAGLYWSGARVLPVLALIGLTGFLVYRKWGPVPRKWPAKFPAAFPTGPYIAAVVTGWVLAMTPSLVAGPATNPVQQWDPSFHMNGVWGITKLGIAAPGVGLAHNYGGAPASDYPLGWHAFTALFATPETAVQTANASSLALMLVWVAAAGIYAWVLYPSRTVVVAGTVIASVLPAMPADALTMYSQWPNAMSVALLPGVAAAGILTGRGLMAYLRGTSRSWKGAIAGPGVVTLAGTLGGIQAHQVFAFNLLVLLTPAVLAGLAGIMRIAWQRRSVLLGVSVVLTVVLGAASVVFVMLTPQVESLRNYPRSGVSVAAGLSQVLTPTPPFPPSWGLYLLSVVVAVLLVAGTIAIVAARASNSRGSQSAAAWSAVARSTVGGPPLWPIGSYLFFAVLTFFAYGPDWAVRTWIVGPWFNDGRRIMEPEALAIVPLAAVGFTWLLLWLVRVWNLSLKPAGARQHRMLGLALGALLLLGTVGGAMDGRIYAARAVLDGDNLGQSGMATTGVLDMMRELPDLLDEDAVVIGDPQAGGMYTQMLGQRWAYFPQLSLLNEDRETQAVLTARFGDLNWDPEVCEAIKTAGITHYFQAADGDYYGKSRSGRIPGLYNVDTSAGFELIAEGDDAAIYRITACD